MNGLIMLALIFLGTLAFVVILFLVVVVGGQRRLMAINDDTAAQAERACDPDVGAR